ncbi:ATP-binding protein [Thalassotalea sp. PLHSN55]|uniref:ATP-binding protein n=1 Tax=Thalassotalea sp. PLHSN55 TaxID=3435888 RepID=UPI003F85394F
MARGFLSGFMSINVKLFLWFWLITITSVIATIAITNQLNKSSTRLSLYRGDAKQLEQIETHLLNARPNNIKRFVMFSPRRYGDAIVIKDMLTGKVVSNVREKITPFADYIAKNDFDNEMKTIRLAFGRITGPKMVSFNNKEYQLFYTGRAPSPSIARKFMKLPAWLRLMVPLFISFVLCWFLARTLNKPLRRIQNAATQLGDGDLTVRVERDSARSDELGSLATSFNLMAEKLQSSMSAQQRLIADVSHELRSPMTRLQLALGLAQKSSSKPDELIKYLLRCEMEVERLDQMIANVLSLSKLENSLYALNVETIDIKTLLEPIIQDTQFIADNKHIVIHFNLNVEGSLSVDVQLLTSAINNVLTNAVKYSPENSSISCTVEVIAQRLLIKVIDTGPGVPEQNINQLFEPFYRVADARDRKTGGTGLGLAIAKQAIVAHQGTISAKNNSEKGLTVTIELPLTI